MSVNDFLTRLETCSVEELNLIQEKLNELQAINHDEETPEMLAAVDEGLRSVEEEGSIPIEDVIKEMATWNLKSV